MDTVEHMDYSDSERNQQRGDSSLEYRGIAIIAIFHTFHNKLKLQEITYAYEDKQLLEDGFKALQYGVVVWDDIMSKDEFLERLRKVSDHSFHSKCETFCMVIITHGEKNGVLYAYDKTFCRQEVYNCFQAEKCSGLKDKLKLFIIHACRGRNYGKGLKASGNSTKEMVPRAKLGDHIEQDNLILCSTFEENVAFAPVMNKGSLFINNLSSVLKEEGSKDEERRKHMIALLRDVIRRTASDCFIIRNEEGDEIIKQQPTLMMALHNLYHFKEKEEIPEDILNNFSVKFL